MTTDFPSRSGDPHAAHVAHADATQSAHARALVQENRRFYDSLWSGCRLVEPARFNTWPLVQSLLPSSGRRLEVAPGLRPRLPIAGTQFVDISSPALAALGANGGHIAFAEVTALPFAEGAFDLVCALDIIEHVDDDDHALAEIARVASCEAAILISTPLHPSRWTAFDDFVGHKRRYEPERLHAKLSEHHLRVERSALFGMQPRSSFLLNTGMWWLTHQRERALWWYNRVFPFGLRFQKPLQLQQGMMSTDDVDEVLLVCRRVAPGL